ncbi:hypothetical protein DICPUDRAFT_81189 [Dictyostelium purpureum]|uniref:Uncharacterized protein n=1 Tax=Dictyostelium purpureum TaxID=5786 RepID=F0ZSR7_DICPU|nr:uncharacterized protein DICPUDRAFT_81189 [Dictyostelium purpureum]EGC32991.1 hypothetical protein DICPUDRAFT_81189 [Dictyostelium purpureum]|eukprot:XP_003290461.1 hypothetical protein DICPUDRAFT_81189 [Dictyostelium purpureum]
MNINFKRIISNSIFIISIPCLIHNHIFTIMYDDNKKNNRFFNNDKIKEPIKSDNSHNSRPNKIFEMITTDSNGNIVSTSTATISNNNDNNNNNDSNDNNTTITESQNIKKEYTERKSLLPFRLIFINKFSKNYKQNDIVALIDPKSPNETIIRKVLVASNDLLQYYATGVPTGSLMYAEPNKVGENSAKVTPKGMVLGKVMFYI